MSNIATYILASLSENKLQKMSFTLDGKLHQIVNAVNMYREITNHDMQYVWFGEFCRVLDAQTKENFYCNVLGGSRNLVETPLGYDSTSHSAFFIGTMHYNFPIDEVDLSNKTTFDPIHCYKVDGKLSLPHDIINDKKSCEDSIYSSIYMDIFHKYEYMRTEARFGEKEGFDKDKMSEYIAITRKESADARDFINAQPDNVEFEYMGKTYIKNIPVDDPEMIYSLLLTGRHFEE